MRQITQAGIDLLHRFEGLHRVVGDRVVAYRCPAGVWTIGFGNTRVFSNATRQERAVREHDSLTIPQAHGVFRHFLKSFESGVDRLVTSDVTPEQFSALVCFAYNVGLGNLGKSTLLKMVNEDPNNTEIREQFMRWDKAGGRPLRGLTRRRAAEADLYYSKPSI